jgi:hypothetical protein
VIKHCIIRNNTIVLNGVIVFQDHGMRLSDFLIKAYVALMIDYPKFYKMDSLSQAGFLASEVLLRDSDVKLKYSAEDVSVVLSSKQGSLDADKKYFESVKTIASPALFVYTLPNIVAGEICIRHKFKGENAFFVTEEFDVTTIGEYVDLMFAQDFPESGAKPKACVAGWVDVLEEHHDVFLYLLQNNRPALTDNTVRQVRSLYNQELWNN